MFMGVLLLCLFQIVANPVDSETIEVNFPSFPAQEITIYLVPEDGFPPELFDVEIVACLSEYIYMHCIYI